MCQTTFLGFSQRFVQNLSEGFAEHRRGGGAAALKTLLTFTIVVLLKWEKMELLLNSLKEKYTKM